MAKVFVCAQFGTNLRVVFGCSMIDQLQQLNMKQQEEIQRLQSSENGTSVAELQEQFNKLKQQFVSLVDLVLQTDLKCRMSWPSSNRMKKRQKSKPSQTWKHK